LALFNLLIKPEFEVGYVTYFKVLAVVSLLADVTVVLVGIICYDRLTVAMTALCSPL